MKLQCSTWNRHQWIITLGQLFPVRGHWKHPLPSSRPQERLVFLFVFPIQPPSVWLLINSGSTVIAECKKEEIQCGSSEISCPLFPRNSYKQRLALQVQPRWTTLCVRYSLCGCFPGKAPSFQHHHCESARVRSAGHDPGKPADDVMIQPPECVNMCSAHAYWFGPD